MFNKNHYDECLACKCASCKYAEECNNCEKCSGQQVCNDDPYANYKTDCENYSSDTHELSPKQLERIDEIENSVFNTIKVMTQNYDMDWDISVIGDIADIISDRLTKLGYKIQYPALVLDEEGNVTGISEFYGS